MPPSLHLSIPLSAHLPSLSLLLFSLSFPSCIAINFNFCCLRQQFVYSLLLLLHLLFLMLTPSFPLLRTVAACRHMLAQCADYLEDVSSCSDSDSDGDGDRDGDSICPCGSCLLLFFSLLRFQLQLSVDKPKGFPGPLSFPLSPSLSLILCLSFSFFLPAH